MSKANRIFSFVFFFLISKITKSIHSLKLPSLFFFSLFIFLLLCCCCFCFSARKNHINMDKGEDRREQRDWEGEKGKKKKKGRNEKYMHHFVLVLLWTEGGKGGGGGAKVDTGESGKKKENRETGKHYRLHSAQRKTNINFLLPQATPPLIPLLFFFLFPCFYSSY